MKNIIIVLVISILGGGLTRLGTPPLPQQTLAPMSSNLDDYGAKKGAPPAPAPTGPATATPSVAGGSIIYDDTTSAPRLTVLVPVEKSLVIPDNVPQSFKTEEIVHELVPEDID